MNESGPGRDWAESDYVRVYQHVRDDPKFATVYPDDRRFGAYTRLLMDAELAWPVRPSLPAWLAEDIREDLIVAGILIVSGLGYTISGLTKERESRGQRYSGGTGRRRYPSDGGPAPATVSEPAGVESESPRSESDLRAQAGATSASSSDSYSENDLEHGGQSRRRTREALPAAVLEVLERRAERRWRYRPDDTVYETLAADIRTLGEGPVLQALASIDEPHPDFPQLVFGATRWLHRIATPAPPDEPDADYVRQQLAKQRNGRTAGATAG